ncbi:MAG: hypothetical protein MP439_09730 [Ferrimicrobium sp.]|nr:hypothetical protein [Ferrimicrobium sp.]
MQATIPVVSYELTPRVSNPRQYVLNLIPFTSKALTHHLHSERESQRL